jgi:uncharacterized membrane protein
MNSLQTISQMIKYIILLVGFDIVYIYFIANYFNTQIRMIQGSPIVFNQKMIVGAAITYILLAFALSHFVSSPRNAFLLGICIYGVYDMTNYALFNKWALQTALMDMLWGGTLFFLVYKMNSFMN